MKWNSAFAVPAAFALALTAVLVGQAHAGSCGNGYILEHGDVECLDADRNKPINLQSHGKLWDRDQFSERGLVVAESGTEGAAEVDLERSCMDQFRASSASDTCENVSAEFHKPDRCFISAACMLSDTGYNGTSIEASWSDTARLSNCNGILAVGEC